MLCKSLKVCQNENTKMQRGRQLSNKVQLVRQRLYPEGAQVK